MWLKYTAKSARIQFSSNSYDTSPAGLSAVIVLAVLFFFIAACKVLCFGFVMKTVLITKQ